MRIVEGIEEGPSAITIACSNADSEVLRPIRDDDTQRSDRAELVWNVVDPEFPMCSL
jgi:hypothetical protein